MISHSIVSEIPFRMQFLLRLVRLLTLQIEDSTNNEFPGGSVGKASACNVRDPGLIPGWGRCPGEGNGNPFKYSCLENPMDGGAWWSTVHGAAKSRTRLSNFTFII